MMPPARARRSLRLAGQAPSVGAAASGEGGLLGCPAEILQETFAMLDHEDLVALSRTCRALRALLLTRATGLIIYRRVFAGLFDAGLPHPTPHLSLPQYASLLALKTCSVRSLALVAG